MNFYKFKNNGKYFIYIEDTGKDEALFVSFESRIMVFNFDLFEEADENDEDILLSRGLITESQVQLYNEYKKNRLDELIDELTTSQMKEVLERLKERLKSE